jgi:glutamate N-acetyltransferase/amino-acid N-acetyltransferase
MKCTLTKPKGFLAVGIHAGIKKAKKDLSIIYSEQPAEVAGCFTKNKVKAAPVVWSQGICEAGGKVRAIVTNSGNANACTGLPGYENARAMASLVAELSNCSAEEVLVCSTGVIGVPLPMDKVTTGIRQAIPLLSGSQEAGWDVLEAIMTTDTIYKEASEETTIGGVAVKVSGIAKGSGMIHPNMGTMLSFIATDCAIEKRLLQKALSSCVDLTFNMVSIDGDTSTNDTCLALANGMAENPIISNEGEEYEAFEAALLSVLRELAIFVAMDGEGASRLMEVQAIGARSYEDARLIARGIAASTLFKAALFGADANFGRVLCAMGYSGGEFDPDKVSMEFENFKGSVKPFINGLPAPFDEKKAKEILSQDEVLITVSLNDGNACATAWGCDLTYEYVKINGDYRS